MVGRIDAARSLDAGLPEDEATAAEPSAVNIKASSAPKKAWEDGHG